MRTLALRRGAVVDKKFVPADGVITKIAAEPGSLIVLPSEFNLSHGHAVLADPKVTGVRYAINAKHLPEAG